jgi:hypothetical protein
MSTDREAPDGAEREPGSAARAAHEARAALLGMTPAELHARYQRILAGPPASPEGVAKVAALFGLVVVPDAEREDCGSSRPARSPLTARGAIARLAPSGSAPGTLADVTTEDDSNAEQPSVLPTALAAGAGALAGVRLGPGGEIAGALAGPYLEIMLRRSFAEFGADAKRRVTKMMDSARETAGCTDAELEERLLRSEGKRLFNITAINAAAATAWPQKVVALGRVLAAGLIAEDEAAIDVEELALAAMTDMEKPHVVLLDLLVRFEPEAEMGIGWTAVPQAIPSYLSDFVGGGGPLHWRPCRRVWTAAQIFEVRPQLRPVVTSLLGTLERHGLARLNDSGPAVAKQLGEDLAKQVNKQAGQAQRGQRPAPVTLRPPSSMREIPPSWSPTELGERVLGFYEDAASEAGGADRPAEHASG